MEHMIRLHIPSLDGDATELSRLSDSHFKVVRKHNVHSHSCEAPPPFAESSATAYRRRPATCADLRAGRHDILDGVRLVLGITSAPDKWGQLRRRGIRQTWMRYPAVGRAVVMCFIVGRKELKPKEAARLDAEQEAYDDFVFLRHTLDGRGPFVTISKAHAWFRLASEMIGLIGGRPQSSPDDWSVLSAEEAHAQHPRFVLGGSSAAAAGRVHAHHVRHIAKVDDDTYLHLPELQRDLDSLHCHPHMYYGMFAYAGYNSRTFLKCGFDYSSNGGRYRKYGCAAPQPAERGGSAHPPFPFTSGAIMIATTPLIVRMATEPSVGEFVARSSHEHHTDEDVAMGYWISRFHLGGLQPPVAYIEVNKRLTNLGCHRHSGLYQAPRNRSVGVHFLKTPGGMHYVWSILVDGLRHNATRCQRMTGDGRL
jgi:hypothetical protein